MKLDNDMFGIENNSQSDYISHSVSIKPSDSRCRYWANIFRLGDSIPLPVNVQGASDLVLNFLKQGDDELFSGDFLIEGEEMHHRKYRGWCYRLTFINSDGELISIRPSLDHKQQLKTQGLNRELLSGSGELAAIIRIIHVIKSGLKIELV